MISNANSSSGCCKGLVKMVNANSPFSKLLGLGFYDGPTSGFVQCGNCSAVFRFSMIDWDNRQEVRVVSLSPLPGEAFQELVDALSKYELPKWPIWVPKWQFSSEEAKRIADSQVARTLEEASNPNLIVAWSRYGEVIIAAKPVSEPDLGDIQEWLSPQESKGNRDWFIFLGLRRDEDK